MTSLQQKQENMDKMEFLQLNIIDDYTMGIGHVDISDQLQGSYWFDHWLQHFKW